MSKKKIGSIILFLLLLTIIGGLTYLIVTKKYFPKVEGVEYLSLELVKDTALVKTGINVQNRIPLPIAIDSVYYVLIDEGDTLGVGQMTSDHTLPPLNSNVIDFRLLLDFEKYREHIKANQGKDSIRVDVALNIFFDLPLISPKNITLNRHIVVPVAKSPALEIRDIKVRSFSVEEGYSLLLRIDAKNRDLPNMQIEKFQYSINLSDSLTISGQVDSTFSLQNDSRLIEIPLPLETQDAIALIRKKLSGDKVWDYKASIEAQIKSEHPLFDSFKLTVEKEGELDISQMGTGENYLPKISRITKLEIDSDEEKTRIQADIVVKNPTPFPFYVDSVSYFIRHKGKVIARGKRNLEKILPKSGTQNMRLGLVVDESAYQNFMKSVQGQDKVALDIELNLIYNLSDTGKPQKITLKRQIQAPVPGQAGIQVTDLVVKELDPQKGAHLGLQLKIQSSNLPDLQIHDLTYQLQLSNDILITGKTDSPIKITGEVAEIEVPLQLTSEDVNQLVKKAISGSTDWKYNLNATALLKSSNKMLSSTKIDLAFKGELELKKGMAGGQMMPKVDHIDSLKLTIHYDTAWAELNIRVTNPLPVPIYIDSLALKITHTDGAIVVAAEEIQETLPSEGSNSGWINFAINYGFWHELIKRNQSQDSLALKQEITLSYSLGELKNQTVSFSKAFKLPTPKVPATKLKTVKFSGISLTKGIVLNALIQVQNSNTAKLEISDITYNFRVENFLDACGTINRTYDIPLGQSIVKVPLSLSIGETLRAFFARLSGNKKERELFIDVDATVVTASPLIKKTHVQYERREKKALFQKNSSNN